jgi:YjbE family integral membrane protein
MLSWLGPLGGIILVDLVLSGDNALVIGAAASKLPRKQRWLAILLGGGGAIVLRIAFAIIATLLLQLPLLKAIGGALLMVIAVRLLMDRNTAAGGESEQQKQTAETGVKRSFFPALMTILVADVTMSLDNVLAVGALAAGELLILAIGLVVSILFLLVGSALISELISRLPWLLDLASLVLGWTAAHMILDDINLGPVLDRFPWTDYAIPAVAIALILAADLYLRWRDHHKQNTRHA